MRNPHRPTTNTTASLLLILFLTPNIFIPNGAFHIKSQIIKKPFLSLSSSSSSSSNQNHQPYGNILLLDHININHERSRHDIVDAFYFKFLRCSIDPRKMENYDSGRKTLWANIGCQQFHLPEGRKGDDGGRAQVLRGVISLLYDDLDGLLDRFKDDGGVLGVLKDTMFDCRVVKDGDERELDVTDPWGNKFRIFETSSSMTLADYDDRGVQKGDGSEGLGMTDLTLYVPSGCNLEGIGRFYERVLCAPVLRNDNTICVVSVGPKQTLSFLRREEEESVDMHVDLLGNEGHEDERAKKYPSNYGPHISIYVSNIRDAYRKAEELGVSYVNPRFNRRAYTEEEVVDDCMFRCLDIVDPNHVEGGVIVRLEHEVRSVVKRDGTMYKSCPFFHIPEGCVV